MTDDVVIGGDTAAMEHLFDDFLRHMEQFDRRLSVQTQKIILRNAAAPAVKGLRAATRRTWPKRTGRAWRSVRTITKESKTFRGAAYTVWGWSNKGLGMEQQRRPENGIHQPKGEAPAAAEARHVYRHMGRPRDGTPDRPGNFQIRVAKSGKCNP